MMCAGKSTIAKLLVEADIPVYDADSRVKALYDVPEVRNTIEKEFIPKKKYFYKGGLFDKQAAISYIFSEAKPDSIEEFEANETKRLLENILMPFIEKDFKNFIQMNSGANMVGFESATLLTMKHICERMNYIIWVEAKRETLLKRAFERNGFTEKMYDSRMRPVMDNMRHSYFAKGWYNISFKIKNEDGTTLGELREQIYNYLKSSSGFFTTPTRVFNIPLFSL